MAQLRAHTCHLQRPFYSSPCAHVAYACLVVRCLLPRPAGILPTSVGGHEEATPHYKPSPMTNARPRIYGTPALISNDMTRPAGCVEWSGWSLPCVVVVVMRTAAYEHALLFRACTARCVRCVRGTSGTHRGRAIYPIQVLANCCYRCLQSFCWMDTSTQVNRAQSVLPNRRHRLECGCYSELAPFV